MAGGAQKVVAADTSVLINLVHVGRLELCARLPGLEFVLPDHVYEEVRRPEQRKALNHALEAGIFEQVSLIRPADIVEFVELTRVLGRGEAACLVLAARNGWLIASDEKGRFRREALARMDESRLLGTVEIYARALRAELLTLEQADADKATLEGKRFRMRFESFRDLF